MSDGTASFGSDGTPLPTGTPAPRRTGAQARVLQLPVRERMRRRRRLAAFMEWAALLGMGFAAALILLVAAVSLIAR